MYIWISQWIYQGMNKQRNEWLDEWMDLRFHKYCAGVINQFIEFWAKKIKTCQQGRNSTCRCVLCVSFLRLSFLLHVGKRGRQREREREWILPHLDRFQASKKKRQTDGQTTDPRTDGWTKPLMELRGLILKYKNVKILVIFGRFGSAGRDHRES